MAPPRTSLLDRAPIIDKISGGLQGAWDKGWLPPIVLEPEVLWERAAKGSAAEDEFGGRSAEDAADFRERLDVLCKSLTEEARLTPLGQAFAHGQLVRAIRQRVELGRLWHEKPEILETKLAPPIIVIGQMRAGTTRVHRLLGADPRHATTRFCDSWHPVPTKPDFRPVWSGMALFGARRLNPWLDTIHPFGASRADEELGWLASTLDHGAYEAQWHIPKFVSFSEARGSAPVYREFARILRTDAAHHANAHLPRVMKVPQFAEDLPQLLEQFPTARIIVTERGADATIRSSVSLVANQMTMQSGNVDLEQLEAEWTRKTELRKGRMRSALTDFAGPVAHVDFAALDADWESAIDRIYGALSIPMTGSAKAAMRAEQKRAEKSAHHGHQSDLRNLTGAQ